MTIVQVPRVLDPETGAGLALRLEHMLYEESLTIDFSRLIEVAPFGALVAAAAIRRIVKKRLMFSLRTTCSPPNAPLDSLQYLRNIGFFQFVGVKAGNQPGTIFRDSKASYNSLGRIPKDFLDQTGNRIQNDIESIARQIAAALAGTLEDNVFVDMFGYCLREAMRNTFEHAKADSIFYLLKLHSDQTVEMALMDEGIGIHSSLARVLKGHTPRHTVEASIKPGITEYQGPETEDTWQNSGFGLYILSELGKRYGTFSISSSGWLLSLTGKRRIWSQLPLEGTLLRLRIKIPEPEYFPNIREQIVRLGEEAAVSIPGARTSASKGSRSGLVWSK